MLDHMADIAKPVIITVTGGAVGVITTIASSVIGATDPFTQNPWMQFGIAGAVMAFLAYIVWYNVSSAREDSNRDKIAAREDAARDKAVSIERERAIMDERKWREERMANQIDLLQAALIRMQEESTEAVKAFHQILTKSHDCPMAKQVSQERRENKTDKAENN